jgi:hypothetical protein
MTRWVDVGPYFIVGDVIRFDETVWELQGRYRPRRCRMGERNLCAEVIKEPDENGFVSLRVIASEGYRPIFVGTEINRKITTIARAKTERLLWSDEDVRARLIAEKGDAWKSSISARLTPSKGKGRKGAKYRRR